MSIRYDQENNSEIHEFHHQSTLKGAQLMQHSFLFSQLYVAFEKLYGQLIPFKGRKISQTLKLNSLD